MTATIEELVGGADENAIWPVDMPPPLDDPAADDELSQLHTLEERILHKYTPSKLALDSIHVATKQPGAARAAAPEEGLTGDSSVKACPECSGLGKVSL